MLTVLSFAGLELWPGSQFCLLGSSTQRERVCLDDVGIRHDGVSRSLLSIVNEGAAIN
jgi:hypothetical protein